MRFDFEHELISSATKPISMVERLICYVTKMKITSIYYCITFFSFTMNFSTILIIPLSGYTKECKK
jgi:hypothetical protein